MEEPDLGVTFDAGFKRDGVQDVIDVMGLYKKDPETGRYNRVSSPPNGVTTE